MSTVKRGQLKFNRAVMRSMRDFLPDELQASPESLMLARKLLSAYGLCQVNSVNYPDSMIEK